MDRLLGWWDHIWVFRMKLPRLLACWCCWWAWRCFLLNVDAVLWDFYSLGQGIRTLRPPGMTLLLGIWSSWPVSIRSLSSANVRIRGSSSLLSWSDNDDVGNGAAVTGDLDIGPSCEHVSYSLASSSVIEFPDVLYIVVYVNSPKKKRFMSRTSKRATLRTCWSRILVFVWVSLSPKFHSSGLNHLWEYERGLAFWVAE